MSRAARTKHRDRRQLAAIVAAEPSGPIICAAEQVVVEQGIEAAEGRAARRPSFSILAYTGGLLRVGWSRPLVVDLAGLRAGRTTVLLDHDPSQIVGQGQAGIGDGKITVAGEITGDLAAGTPAGQVASHARNGFVWAASVGVSPERIEPVDGNQQVTVNGREFNGPIYVVRAGRLGEVSFVGVGADEQATATVAAAQRGRSDPMTFDQWLKIKGLDSAKMSAAEFQALQSQFQTEHPTSPVAAAAQPATMPTAAITAAAPMAGQPGTPGSVQGGGLSRIDAEIAEYHRREAIEGLAYAAVVACGRNPVQAGRIKDLAARAIEAGTTVRDFEMELLRLRVPPPQPHEHRGDAASASTLQAAALLAAGHSADTVVRDCGERNVEAARQQFGHQVGLQEIILSAANANGYIGRQRITTANWREVLSWAIPDIRVRASGLSTIDLSNILGAVANKAMAKVAAEPTWLVPALCGLANHSNFHAHTVCSLAMNGELATVAPSGELQHLNLSEETYTRQVGTRGAVLRLSRTDIVNDDLGAFDRMAQALARKSYATREKVFFTLLMASAAGASHFTAARGNYVTGTGTAFGAAGLGNAVKVFRNLTGPDGDPVMVDPVIVLVPPTLEFAARSLLLPGVPLVPISIDVDGTIGMGAAGNPYGGKFGGAPLTSGYLETSTITGNSTAYWYLFADPGILPCYEIAYLNGQQAPVVEYFGLETEADSLAVAWRVYWDFGVAAAEWRAGVKSAGA